MSSSEKHHPYTKAGCVQQASCEAQSEKRCEGYDHEADDLLTGVPEVHCDQPFEIRSQRLRDTIDDIRWLYSLEGRRVTSENQGKY